MNPPGTQRLTKNVIINSFKEQVLAQLLLLAGWAAYLGSIVPWRTVKDHQVPWLRPQKANF